MTLYVGITEDDPPVVPDPAEAALAEALRRYLLTASAPAYLVKAATPWLTRRT